MILCSGLNKLILSKSAQSSDDPDMKAMKSMNTMGGMPMAQPPMAPMGQGYDPNPQLKTARQEIKVVRHEWMCRDADKKLLKKWKGTS